jgi:hypothetical protein
MMFDENQLLGDVLIRLSSSGRSLNLGYDEIEQWPSGFVNLLEQGGLLIRTVKAQSLECTGCEYRCFMPVVFADDALRAFIVCDNHEQQEHVGRINVDLMRLQQWELNINQVAVVLTKLLGIESKPVYEAKTGGYILGVLKGAKGRRTAALVPNPLSVIINQHMILVNELLYIEEGILLIDMVRINDSLSANSLGKGKPYSPNTDRQQARKMATLAMYDDWKDECRKLEKLHPNKPDTWIAKKISKMPIAKGRSEGTIRKKMK